MRGLTHMPFELPMCCYNHSDHWEDAETSITPSPDIGILDSAFSVSGSTSATSPIPTYTSSASTSPIHTTTSSTYTSTMTPNVTVSAASPVAMEMGDDERGGQCSGHQEKNTVTQV